jgi:hypothetical protein
MFYVVLLELARSNILVVTDTEIQPEHDLDIYEIEEVLDTRQKKDNQQEYLVK